MGETPQAEINTPSDLWERTKKILQDYSSEAIDLWVETEYKTGASQYAADIVSLAEDYITSFLRKIKDALLAEETILPSDTRRGNDLTAILDKLDSAIDEPYGYYVAQLLKNQMQLSGADHLTLDGEVVTEREAKKGEVDSWYLGGDSNLLFRIISAGTREEAFARIKDDYLNRRVRDAGRIKGDLKDKRTAEKDNRIQGLSKYRTQMGDISVYISGGAFVFESIVPSLGDVPPEFGDFIPRSMWASKPPKYYLWGESKFTRDDTPPRFSEFDLERLGRVMVDYCLIYSLQHPISAGRSRILDAEVTLTDINSYQGLPDIVHPGNDIVATLRLKKGEGGTSQTLTIKLVDHQYKLRHLVPFVPENFDIIEQRIARG